MPTAIVNTMLANTQCGRYCNGPVRNKSTTNTRAGGEGALRDLAARARLIRHCCLGRAAVDDEGPADRRCGVGGGYAQNVCVFVDAFFEGRRVYARGRRALRDDHDEA